MPCPSIASTDAAIALEAARRLAPDRHEVLMRVGEMRSRFGRHTAALSAFQAAERLRPQVLYF